MRRKKMNITKEQLEYEQTISAYKALYEARKAIDALIDKAQKDMDNTRKTMVR